VIFIRLSLYESFGFGLELLDMFCRIGTVSSIDSSDGEPR